jgi:conjugative relaxase-like TrwC/TraI family protein
MIRFRPLPSATAAAAYYGRTDGGYYLGDAGLRREVGGGLAGRLGLGPDADFVQFERLLGGQDPHSGGQLTAKLVDGRLSGWDVTASVPKSVTLAIERGDARVRDALWEANRETMAELEGVIRTRVRKGGLHDDRVTANACWFSFEHPETRPNRGDGMPDPDRHIHNVLLNLTYDPAEREVKAVKFRNVMDLRKWFDRRFDLRLSKKLADLGYGIETKYRSGKYFSWDIAGMPASAVKKFSRRGAEIDALAETLDLDSPVAKDKLAATSRLGKRDDLTLDDLRRYWDSRLTPDEAAKIAEVIGSAVPGRTPKPENTADKAMAWAVRHEFERRSVVPLKDLEVTAMERALGAARPEEFGPEAGRQGVLVRDGQATTRDVLAEERKIVSFARDGRGTVRPLVAGPLPDLSGLSAEQRGMAVHVLTSPDRVMLVRGAAGTGKSHALRAIVPAIKAPVAVLAPTAKASRDFLREAGFEHADTVAAFLLDKEWQAGMRGGVIVVDESGLLPVKDLSALVDVARERDARLVLQGDPRQNKSVLRNGNMFRVLKDFAGLQVAELRDIRRQSGRYKEAVAAIEAGDILKGHDIFSELGWVKQVTGDGPLVDDYLDALATKRGNQSARDRAIILAPTHAAGDAITRQLRTRLKEAGKLGAEVVLPRLVPLHWSEPEREDLARYDGGETLVFHTNSGTFKNGQRMKMADWKPGDRFKSGKHFAVYGGGQIAVAPGDLIRTTANVKDAEGKRIDNGTYLTVTRVTPKAIEVTTASGRPKTLPADVGHITHGYVATSIGDQGATTDFVFAAMGAASLPAVKAEQYYTDLSRARHQATLYTDLDPDRLRAAVVREDSRRSATELMAPPRPRLKARRRQFLERLRDAGELLINRAIDGINKTLQPEREVSLGR